MGLAVGVGVLAEMGDGAEDVASMRELFAGVNGVREENGLPVRGEPEALQAIESRCQVLGFPYSCIHYLRRFYANIDEDPDWQPVPVPPGEDPAEDPIVEDVGMMFDSHLLCHSDCEGFYLPIDFDAIIIDMQADGENGRIPGGMLGSSYRLREELLEIAAPLGITLVDGALSDAEAERLNRESEGDADFAIEKMVWLSLFEAARLSITHKTAICFG